MVFMETGHSSSVLEAMFLLTLPENSSSPLKMDGFQVRNLLFPQGPLFSGARNVRFREGFSMENVGRKNSPGGWFNFAALSLWWSGEGKDMESHRWLLEAWLGENVARVSALDLSIIWSYMKMIGWSQFRRYLKWIMLCSNFVYVLHHVLLWYECTSASSSSSSSSSTSKKPYLVFCSGWWTDQCSSWVVCVCVARWNAFLS